MRRQDGFGLFPETGLQPLGSKMSWTDERVEMLRKLWTDGHSANQIARQLGGVTRNAVIGKVHRLGLSGRITPARPPKRIPRPKLQRPQQNASGNLPALPRQPAPPRPAPQLDMIEPDRLSDGSLRSVRDLSEQVCKWPIGDPAEKGFGFCGREKACNSPYCAEHARVAFLPQVQKKKRPADAWLRDEMRWARAASR